jgi:hypothetical protein
MAAACRPTSQLPPLRVSRSLPGRRRLCLPWLRLSLSVCKSGRRGRGGPCPCRAGCAGESGYGCWRAVRGSCCVSDREVLAQPHVSKIWSVEMNMFYNEIHALTRQWPAACIHAAITRSYTLTHGRPATHAGHTLSYTLSHGRVYAPCTDV